MNYPKITAVMITGKHPDRYPMAQQSIKCFENQTYPGEKELIIVTTSNEHLYPSGKGFRRIFCPDENATLGELRNIALDAAKDTDLITQWDDDDWFHPYRLEWQEYYFLTESATLMERQYRIDLTSEDQGIFDTRNIQQHGIYGSIMHEPTKFRYPLKSKSEDVDFAHMIGHAVVDNPPWLFVRTYHGANTWDKSSVISRRLTRVGESDFLKYVRTHYRHIQFPLNEN